MLFNSFDFNNSFISIPINSFISNFTSNLIINSADGFTSSSNNNLISSSINNPISSFINNITNNFRSNFIIYMSSKNIALIFTISNFYSTTFNCDLIEKIYTITIMFFNILSNFY